MNIYLVKPYPSDKRRVGIAKPPRWTHHTQTGKLRQAGGYPARTKHGGTCSMGQAQAGEISCAPVFSAPTDS